MIIPQLNKFDTTIILICNTTENYVNLENHNFSLDFGIFSLVKFKRKKHLPSKIKYFKFWLKWLKAVLSHVAGRSLGTTDLLHHVLP